MATHNKTAGIHVQSQRGALRIWEHPKAGEKYTIGIDSSEGIRGGDFACAQVVANSDCRQVATYHGLFDPNEWGRLTCELGWHFNSAMLAFETGASTHGTTAVLVALALNYPNLYRRRVMDSVVKKYTTRLGWETKEKSKRMLLDRIRLAITERTKIRCAELVAECLTAAVVEGGTGESKVEFAGHNDYTMAYGIALVVRDEIWAEEAHEAPPATITDLAELHWQDFERSLGGGRSMARQPANEPR